MKKILAFAVAFVMLLGVSPSALALLGNAPELLDNDPAVIHTVEITGVIAPALGNAPSYNAAVAGGNGYKLDYSLDGTLDVHGTPNYVKNAVQWYDGFAAVPFDSTFEAGIYYEVYIFVTAEEGRTFDYMNLSATVNGNMADIVLTDDTSASVRYQFLALEAPDTQEILSVEFSGTVKAGTVLNDNTLTVSNPGIKNVTISWSRNGEPVSSGSVAATGEYTAYIEAFANPGYELTTQTIFKALGSGGVPDYVAVGGVSATYSAKVKVKCSHSGNTDNNYYSDDEGHMKICSVCKDPFDKEQHVFDAGVVVGTETVYTCEVCGYQYGVSNGDAGNVLIELPEYGIGKTYSELLKNVKVTFENGAPSLIIYTVTAQSETDSEAEIIIYNVETGTYMLPGGGDVAAALAEKIKPYFYYDIQIEVKPDKTVDANKVTVTDAGHYAASILTEFTEDYHIITLVGYAVRTNVVSALEFVKLPAAEHGKAPSNEAEVSTYGASVKEVAWSTQDKFMCDTEYKLTVTVELSEGLVFAPELTAESEGMPQAVITLAGDGEEKTVAVIEYTFPAEEHKFGKWKTIKSAEEGVEGSKQRTCSVCGYVETEVIPALEHEHKFETLYSDASGHWYACACGETDAKSDHDYGDWVVITEPEIGVEGERQRVCTVCGYQQTEIIDALEPEHEHEYYMKYDEDGHWGVCSCGATTEKYPHEADENGVCKFCGYVMNAADTSEEEAGDVSDAVPGDESDAGGESSVPGDEDHSGKIGVIIAVIVMACAGGAAGVWLFLKKKNESSF